MKFTDIPVTLIPCPNSSH